MAKPRDLVQPHPPPILDYLNLGKQCYFKYRVRYQQNRQHQTKNFVQQTYLGALGSPAKYLPKANLACLNRVNVQVPLIYAATKTTTESTLTRELEELNVEYALSSLG